MTLSDAQQDVLDSLIGNESFSFCIIQEDKTIDLGTKKLYLERAIKEPCEAFLSSLDKLYNPSLTAEDAKVHLNLIHSFKFINDLFRNNHMKNGEYGLRLTRDHCFARLGDLDHESLSSTISDMINKRIEELTRGNDVQVMMQNAARLEAEAQIVPQPGWRVELDLPLAQLIQHVNRPVTYMQNTMSVAEARNELLKFTWEMQYWKKHVNTPIDEVLYADPALCIELVKQSSAVAKLIGFGSSVQKLMSMDKAVRNELFNNIARINPLLRNSEMTLDQLSELPSDKRALILSRSYNVSDLLNVKKIPLNSLLNLSFEDMQTTITDIHSVDSKELQWRIRNR